MGLVIRNALQTTVLDGSSFFLINLARLLVVGATIGVSYIVFYVTDIHQQLIYPWVPIVVAAVASIVVSYPFFLVHK